MTMNDTKISMPVNLVNAVLQYLGTRPYGEVYQLIQAVQAAAIPQLPAEEKPDEAAGGTD